MRRALLPLLAAVALAVTAVAAPAAKTPARKASAKAVALVVQVVRPGADPVALGSLRTRSGSATGRGDYAFPADGSAVRVSGATTAVEAAASGTEASAHTTVTGGSVSLLGGLVTAASLRVAARADANAGRAESAIRARVSGLRVAGVAVDATTNDVIDLPGVGTLTVSETVEAIRSPGGRRTFTVALHVRIKKATAGLEPGSEILVGYAEGGAAAPKPPVVAKAATATPTTTTVASTPAPPVVAPVETGNGGGRDTSRTQQPPPGGFTRTPPIRDETRAELLGGQYVFPVAGGGRYSDDFGGPRAETGFHQGIDVFAANGTPLVAVHDGTLFRVGWNRLGGWRLWLDDGQGNYFYYAHLSAYSDVAVDGASVHAGDVIGYMGDSGDAKGTPFHLHFEMHPDGGWAVPPIAYLSAWEHATPGVGAVVPATGLTTTPPAIAPPATPEGAELESVSDISQASGLDEAGLVQSAGGGAEGSGPVAEPDALVVVGAENQPGFAGLTG
ncbi:MAG: peptidoglycan LD-endopeptidase LytH [Gaiellaceae bacterium]|nr:peptidoglycan LD-endopeptidase LytH [Gaiellaceae bacterium]